LMSTIAPDSPTFFLPRERIDRNEALRLLEEASLFDLGIMAEEAKRRFHAPDAPVTFVIDRNVNYTNVCNVDCLFCAFYRKSDDPDAYTLNYEQIKQKTEELV